MCDFPKLCRAGTPMCPCTVVRALLTCDYSEAAQLLRDHPKVIGVPVPVEIGANHSTRFGLYLITRLPIRFLNLTFDPDFKEVADIVLETLREYPATFQEYRMQWALASERNGACLWAQEYIDAINSGEVSIESKPHLRPRETPAMIAAWDAWTTTERDREREREAREREALRSKPPAHALSATGWYAL